MKTILLLLGYSFFNALVMCNHDGAGNKEPKTKKTEYPANTNQRANANAKKKQNTNVSNNENANTNTNGDANGNGRQDVKNTSYSSSTPDAGKDALSVTPEKFGAIGDGKIHKLSSSYSSLKDAQKDFPGVKDLDITIDGAAIQKAVDYAASKNGGEVVAEKNYAINFPIITRNNVIIDGKNKGIIYNDRSRVKYLHQWAFLIGNHHGVAFNTADNSSGAYKMYNVAGSLTAGQNNVQLANPSDASSLKVGQLVMIISAFKRQQLRKTLLPYHITMDKIVRMDGSKLYFEYPVDENLEGAQIAANGGYDGFAEINFEGVENVTIRNLTIDAGQITGRCYGYKCHIDNIKLINGVRIVGTNALSHSTITNITGTFSWRCIEIKTGSSDLLIRNINATYKALADTDHCRGVISTGEYNRNITIDSFKIDLESQNIDQPIITLQARKAVISNGIIYCKNQTNSFLKFYNEHYIPDPEFGCYGNKVSNVKFYGSPSMKNVLSIGDREGNNNRQNKVAKRDKGNTNNKKAAVPEGEGTPPTANVVENCLFDGGSATSFAALNEGDQNVVRNCVFTKAKLKISPAFQQKNTISNNKE